MIEPLTPAEIDVLAELIAGPDRTNQGIADRIGISPYTVKSHMAELLAKTGETDRTGLALWGVRRLEARDGKTTSLQDQDVHIPQ